MIHLFKDLKPLFPVVQTVFFSRVTYTEKEETTLHRFLPQCAGYPTTYSLRSFYALRPDFSFGKNDFQKAVGEFEGVRTRALNEEDSALISKVLQHWKHFGDNEAAQYSHIILQREKTPKLIVQNAGYRDALPHQSRCKVIHLESLEMLLNNEKRRDEDNERGKQRMVVLGVLGALVGLSSISAT